MQNPWSAWWNATAETLGITLAFAFGGAGFALWMAKDTSIVRGFVVILAGLMVASAATVIVHGYFGASPFLAPVVGVVCGLVAMPLLSAIAQIGQQRAADIVTGVVNKVFGKKEP